MQFSWLEKLAADGHVSEKAKDEIYETCSHVLKEASEQPFTMAEKAIMALSPFVLGGAAAYVGSKLTGAGAINQATKSALKSRAALLNDPELAPHKEKVHARFGELAAIAPSVAAQAHLATRLVKTRLHDGFTDDDMSRLAQLQATYNQKIDFVPKVQKGLAKKASAHTGELCATLYCLVKEAGIGAGIGAGLKDAGRAAASASRMGTIKEVLKTTAVLSAFPLLGGVGAGAVHEYMDYRDKKKLSENLNKSFEKALAMSDPDKEPLHANKEKARQAFETLTHFAPHVATEPSAARAFMNKLLSYDMGIDVGAVKDLAQIQKDISQSHGGSSPFFTGFGQGAQVLGLGQVLSDSMGAVADPLIEKTRRTVAERQNFTIPDKGLKYHNAEDRRREMAREAAREATRKGSHP